MDTLGSSLSPSASRPIDAAIQRLDFNRASGARALRGPGFKEWSHFTIHAGDFDLLLNFSVSERLSGPSRDARLIALARQNGWTGAVETYEPGEVDIPGGRCGVRFCEQRAFYRDGRYALSIAVAEMGLEANLVLVPEALPAALLNVPLIDGPAINWVVVPRLRASGTVMLHGVEHHLDDVPAYHDRNFGSFRWSSDFAWDFGFSVPSDASSPWALVFVRLQNRARTRVLGQQLLIWHRGRQRRFLVNRDLHVSQRGLLRPDKAPVFPPVMRLLRPGVATDVPTHYTIEGAHPSGDKVRCTFEAQDVAQVLLPNDTDMGVTRIAEVGGTYRWHGTVGGERLEVEGDGVLELLGN